MVNFSELSGIFVVPVAFVILSVLKLLLKKVSVYLCLAPITTYAISHSFSQVFKYSPLSYLGLLFTILGIFLLFYNFRRNKMYTFFRFWRSTTIFYSKVALLIWFILSVYQVIRYIMV